MMTQPLKAMLRDQPRHTKKGGKRAAEIAEMRQVLARDHHPTEDREFRDRRPQTAEPWAERAAIECDRLQNAQAVARAFEVRIVIRVELNRLHPDSGVRLQELDSLASLADEERSYVASVIRRHDAFEIAQRD